MSSGMTNGNILLAQAVDQLPLNLQQARAGSPNFQPQLPLTALEEAKLLMQNRQLLAQLQNHPNAAGFVNKPQVPVVKQVNGINNSLNGVNYAGGNLQHMIKASEAAGNLHGLAQLHGLQAVQQQRNPNLGVPPASNALNNQAALLQAAMLQNPQLYYNNANQMYVQNNPIAAAAAAAAVAASQQAQAQQAQQRAAQQARAAALVLQQQQQQQAVAAQRAGLAHQQQQQQAAMISAAMQRAAAAGQLVMQNNKPVLLQNGNAQGNVNNVQLMQQLQAAAAAQKQAHQLQALNQLKAAMAHQHAAKAVAAQQNGQNAQALLKHLQLQDAMAAANRRVVPGMAHAGAHLGGNLAGQQQLPDYGNRVGMLPQGQVQVPLARQSMLQNAGAFNAAGVQPLNPNGNVVTQALLNAQGILQHVHAAQKPGVQPGQQVFAPRTSLAGSEALNIPGKLHLAADNLPGSPGNAQNTAVNKEQRRLALACVALQLARGGISVDQAIHSGIMGGMSVTDVRFIIECYNAERQRMKESANLPPSASAAASTVPMSPASPRSLVDGMAPAGSPVPSVVCTVRSDAQAGSEAAAEQQEHQHKSGRSSVEPPGSEAGSAKQGSGSNAAKSEKDLPLNIDPASFNALSYGFFGDLGSEGVLLEDLGGLEGELETTEVPDAATLPTHQEVGSWIDDIKGGAAALGGNLLDPAAFSDEAAWLQAAANANKAMWEGAAEDDDVAGNDDLAARLANLDLGSGFF